MTNVADFRPQVKAGNKVYMKCADSHPPLKIGEYKIWGGSCVTPAHHLGEFDIYVGFDRSMGYNYRHYPWNSGESFLFYIQDMSVPKSPAEFKMLVNWLEVQLKLNKRIHLGCLGGHGRTGLVLSALVKQMLGIEDAITYVREGYCKKAVETVGQIDWLNEHYGIKKVAGTKEFHSPSDWLHKMDTKGKSVHNYTTEKTVVIRPVRSKGTIFGLNCRNH